MALAPELKDKTINLKQLFINSKGVHNFSSSLEPIYSTNLISLIDSFLLMKGIIISKEHIKSMRKIWIWAINCNLCSYILYRYNKRKINKTNIIQSNLIFIYIN